MCKHLTKLVEASSPGGTPQQQQSFLLRVRRALDHPEYPWQLRYLGQPELGKNKRLYFLLLLYPHTLLVSYYRKNCTSYLFTCNFFKILGEKNQPTVLRSCIDIACTPNVVEFLSELGCRIEFEYVLKGYLFRKGRMKVTMSKIFRVTISYWCSS